MFRTIARERYGAPNVTKKIITLVINRSLFKVYITTCDQYITLLNINITTCNISLYI